MIKVNDKIKFETSMEQYKKELLPILTTNVNLMQTLMGVLE